jgi:hydrogenase expression/formation protein HypC
MCLAVPMKVVEIVSPEKAIVEAGGLTMDVSIQLLKDVHVGDYVIVHTGFAIEVMNEADAEQTIQLFDNISEISNGF